MRMKRYVMPVLFGLIALLGSHSRAWSNISDYKFIQTSGEPTDMWDAIEVLGPDVDGEISGPLSLGFVFNFNGKEYSSIYVSSHGWVKLGDQPIEGAGDNDLDGANPSLYPIIAPLWDHFRTHPEGGYVRYKVEGEPGTQVVTVEWVVTMPKPKDDGGGEGEGEGEGEGDGDGEEKAAAKGDEDGEGEGEEPPPEEPKEPPVAGPLTFQLRLYEYDGRIEFLYPDVWTAFQKEDGGEEPEEPKEDEEGEGEGEGDQDPIEFITSASIGLAEHAFDFVSITPGKTATLDYFNENDAIHLAETPIEPYTMYVFYVCPAFDIAGNVAEGGLSNMQNGGTLLGNKRVKPGTTATFHPFVFENSLNTQPLPIPTNVEFRLNDPSGLFSIDQSEVFLTPGASVEPAISFTAPDGIGFRTASLEIITQCRTYQYQLRVLIDAPGGQLELGSEVLGPLVPVFADTTECIGEGSASIAIIARNLGAGNFVIDNMTGFRTDTVIQQGTPSYPLLRDEFGALIPSTEYFISTVPGVRLPQGTDIVIPEAGTQVVYLNFSGTRPGRRHARLCIATNAQNVEGLPIDLDAEGEENDVEPVRGLVCVDVFARGAGSHLSAPGSDHSRRPAPMSFRPTDVGTAVLDTFEFVNQGECDLRVSRKAFRFESGDVTDFQVVSQIFSGVPSGDFYTLGLGETAKVVVRFTPRRSGSRRATLRLITNDSSLFIPGIAERGVYYWEAYGQGKSALEALDVTLAPAVIDGDPSKGEVILSNARNDILRIDEIRIEGGNGEFTADPQNPWPGLPRDVMPGEQIALGVVFTPDAGSEDGDREAEVEVVLSNGDTVRASVRGYAGTRLLAVNPPTLFEGIVLDAGEVARRFFTVTNMGTLPVTVTDMNVDGDGAAEYKVSPLHRATLQPGQTEYLEVTYAPTNAAADDATVNIVSNATNGDQVVTLSGDGTSSATLRDTDGNGGSQGVSGVETEVVAGGLALGQSVPNPARGTTEIRYRLAKAGEITLSLYDGQGRLVQVLDQRELGAGEYSVRVDVRDLVSGEYHYRLEQGTTVLTRTMIVVH